MLDRRVETLILGSFPSERSLAARQYYAHPRNQFWRIIGAVLEEPLHELAYGARLERLLAHAIGLWDVIDACERAGSLDRAIRRARATDVKRALRLAPRLRRVVFNGSRAGRAAPRFAAAGLATATLPSSSPALASLPLSSKIALWRRALADGRRKRSAPPPAPATR